MSSVKDVLESLPAGKAITPLLGAAVPEVRDAVMNLGATSEDDKKKMDAMQTEIDRLNKPQTANNPQAQTMKKGGKVSSASKRADGCCVRGKTKGRMV